MDKNKKVIFCIIMFLVIVLFGMLSPVTSPDDYSPEEVYDLNEDNKAGSETSESALNHNKEDNSPEAGVTDDISDNTTVDPAFDNEAYGDTDNNEGNNIDKDDLNSIYGNTSGREDGKADDSYALSEDIEIKLDNMIAGMSIEEKVGQIFFIKNDGRFDESVLETYPVGGIILFSGDFVGETSESVKTKLNAFQNASEIPLLIGVDEEGGSVIRISKYSNLVSAPFSSSRALYYQGGYDDIEADTINKSQILLSYGINVNFAPVCDASFNSGDFMYNRAFGSNIEETCQYTRLVVTTMNEQNIGSVLKHFPGYGNNGDTHTTIIHDRRGYEQFETVDFLPFKAGIEAGAQCILVNHNIVECMDSEWPASLSPKVNSILRNELEYGGVIITDDLMMKGVSEYVSLEEAAVQAVIAGNDMILSTDYAIQYNAVLEAVKEGRITEERLDESIKRILRWKYKLNLLDI